MQLCYCNLCNVFIEDFNPSDESYDFKDDDDVHDNTIIHDMVFSDKSSCYVCPRCLNDGFLMDITGKQQLSNLKK